MVRRLILMRHATAEPRASSDDARPLSSVGRDEARAAGVLLGARREVPQLALVSTAQRARDTWGCLCAGLGVEPEIWFDRTLRDSGPPAVVELLAAVAAEVESVIVVGHNPTMSVVAAAFSDGRATPALESAVADGLPTAGMAFFDVPVAWEDVNARRLRLTQVLPVAAG